MPPSIREKDPSTLSNQVMTMLIRSVLALTLSASLFAENKPTTVSPAEAIEKGGSLAEGVKGWKSPTFPKAVKASITGVTGVAVVPPDVVTAYKKMFADGASQLPSGEPVTLSVNIKGWKKKGGGLFLPNAYTAVAEVSVFGKDGALLAAVEITSTGKEGDDGGLSPNWGEILSSKAWVSFRTSLGL
jgi:hypothetical protein